MFVARVASLPRDLAVLESDPSGLSETRVADRSEAVVAPPAPDGAPSDPLLGPSKGRP